MTDNEHAAAIRAAAASLQLAIYAARKAGLLVIPKDFQLGAGTPSEQAAIAYCKETIRITRSL